MPAALPSGGDDSGGGGGGGGGDERSSLLKAIQHAGGLKALKKVGDPDDQKSQRRATIAAPSSSNGGDLMSALKARMDQRRKGISGGRKAEAEESATADAKPAFARSLTMPAHMPSDSAGGAADDGPISMAGIGKALQAAAANRKDASDDDEDWSDDD